MLNPTQKYLVQAEKKFLVDVETEDSIDFDSDKNYGGDFFNSVSIRFGCLKIWTL